jgi:hypothetical protein
METIWKAMKIGAEIALVALLFIILANFIRACGPTNDAQADTPPTFNCELALADGLEIKRCTSDTDVCHIYGGSISCRAL